MQPVECGDENALLAYTEGILAADRSRDVAAHVDACAACRIVLASMARDRASASPKRLRQGSRASAESSLDTGSAAPHETAPSEAALPGGLIAQYLRKDAPKRESVLSRFWAAVALLSATVLILSGDRVMERRASLVGAAILGALFVYEISLVLLLRRGFFHRLLPLGSTLVEGSVLIAMNFHMTNARPHFPLASPGPLIWVVLVMFSAIRASPRLCIVAGGLAASGYALPFLLDPHLAEANTRGSPTSVPIAHCVVFVIAGIASAWLAQYLVTRAEAALYEIREQDLFGKYILHDLVGAGGMGEVFRATYAPEGGFVRTVALKRVRADLPNAPRLQELLRAEARLSSQLAHPNLVQVLDCGSFRGAFVLVMEFVDGVSLLRLVERAPLPVELATFVGVELATALAYIHTRRGADGAALRLVHCDVNPPNVIVSRLGEVKLCDFGVTKHRDEETSDVHGGKKGYAAPEQLRGDPIDGRADLYALGLTLHHALTGTAPFAAGASALGRMPPRVRTLRSDVPEDLDVLVFRLLATDREQRPRDAATVRSLLQAIQLRLGPVLPSCEEKLGELVTAIASPFPEGRTGDDDFATPTA
jgi:hypothetical protein